MKILITGSDGYIGYPLVIKLKKNNYDILGIDDMSRRNNSISLMDLPKFISKKRCVSEIDEVIKFYKPNIVIHLAEQRSAPISMIDKKEKTMANVTNMMKLLESMREHNIKYLIHVGSMGMYSYDLESNSSIYDETCVIREPHSFYHLTKSMNYDMIQFYTKKYGIKCIELIQGTVWGLGGRYDYDADYGTVVNRFIIFKKMGMPLPIYGTGNQSRSFIHLNDSLTSIMKSIEYIQRMNVNFYPIHQFSEIMTINDIAKIFDFETKYYNNPRKEIENSLPFENSRLDSLIQEEYTRLNKVNLKKIENAVDEYIKNVDKNLLYPKDWRTL